MCFSYRTAHGYPLTVIGVPKTIDNDLVGTSHTPGFGSYSRYRRYRYDRYYRYYYKHKSTYEKDASND